MEPIAVVDLAMMTVGFVEISMMAGEEAEHRVVVVVEHFEAVLWRKDFSSVVLQPSSYPEACNECHSSFQP